MWLLHVCQEQMLDSQLPTSSMFSCTNLVLSLHGELPLTLQHAQELRQSLSLDFHQLAPMSLQCMPQMTLEQDQLQQQPAMK